MNEVKCICINPHCGYEIVLPMMTVVHSCPICGGAVRHVRCDNPEEEVKEDNTPS